MAITIDGSANTIAGLAVGGVPDGTIDADALAADCIDESKIANNGINSEHYNAGSVDLSHLSATGTASATTFLRGDNAWAEAGGGKVLKIQWNHHSGQGSTTSSSYTEVRHSSAFTPTAADSNLIVLISTSIGNDVTAGNGGNANYRITTTVDGTTTTLGPDPVWNRYGKSSGDGGYHGEYVTFSYVYECTSTTAVTFNIEAKSQDGPSHPHVGGRVSDNHYAIGALFTIIEVEG